MSEHHSIGPVQPEIGRLFWVAVSGLVVSALILLLLQLAALIQPLF